MSEATSTRPVVIGIGGCSCSGKTSLARELATQLDGVLFPLDFYYRDLSHMTFAERSCYNFDHPDSLEYDLIVQHVEALRSNRAIDRPIYNFSSHARVKNATDHVEPRRFIIVEGILALHYEGLLPLFDLAIYVDAPHDVCLTRRIYRDTRERGRTEASVREQFETYARPMADKYVLPSGKRAHITVIGTEALDWSIEFVLAELRKSSLLS